MMDGVYGEGKLWWHEIYQDCGFQLFADTLRPKSYHQVYYIFNLVSFLFLLKRDV